jgi:hypothetical protein
MKTIKLCKNCKWASPDYILGLFPTWNEFSKCSHIEINKNRFKFLIAGKNSKASYCDLSREGECGKEGRYWGLK